MKHTKLYFLIILLFTSLLAAKCDCENNSGSKKKKDDEAGKRLKLVMEKQRAFFQDALTKKFGLADIQKLIASHRNNQGGDDSPGIKPTREKDTNTNPVNHPSSQKTEPGNPHLTQLKQEEQQLAKEAAIALEQLEKTPLQPFLNEISRGGISLPNLAALTKGMTEIVADCKGNPALTTKVIQVMEEGKKVLDKLLAGLPKMQQEDISGSSSQSPLERLYAVLMDSLDLQSIGITQDAMDELVASIDEDILYNIDAVLNAPIDLRAFSNDTNRKAYQQLVQKHPSAAKNVLNAVCAVLEETIPSLTKVIDVSLGMLNNIQQQQNLEE